MRIARALACVAGAVALTVAGAPAFADEATPIHLAEVYDVTPGVSATHEVTLSTDAPLLSEQCQSMGTGARATSTVSVEVNGVAACRFTWDLDDSGAEVLTVDDGGVFRFHSVSASLLEGFSSPEALASIDSVTLVAHASEIVEASAGGAITSPGASTKKDASTVTWTQVSDDVSATGTVDLEATAMPASPAASPSAAPASREGRGGGSSRSSLTLIVAMTGAVVALALAGAVARSIGRSRRASADAQFERDAALRAAQRAAARSARQASTAHADARLGLVRDALTPPVGMPPAPEADPPPAGMPPAPEADPLPAGMPPAPEADPLPADAPPMPEADPAEGGERFAPPPGSEADAR